MDDIIIMASTDEILQKAKGMLGKRFKMADMGKMRWFIGINVIDKEEVKFVTQTSYIDKTTHQCKPIDSKMNEVPLCKLTDYKRLIFTDQSKKKTNHPYREMIR